MEKLREIYESFYNALIPEQRYLAYLDGLKMTLLISFFAVILGVIIGIVVATVRVSAKSSKNVILKILAKICSIYITVFRGTPLMVQLMIIYYMIFTSRNTNPIVVGAVCFGLNSGAYVAEIVRAGIESVDYGQMEAGRSLGFTGLQTMRYIILPQAVKNILPALGNEFIVLVKETSVISVIAINDLTKMAGFVGTRTFDPLPPYIIAACVYLVIVLILSKLLSIFERRLAKSDHN
ncbi:MAG: amino acid ABC transporter permease [Lachnospiraceae bacterium]|jgi:His/Glu/Gln/Arg/opine family amino acid ABC transporter permease subunit|nr:amino acid ABC transporter permease [Lachnospiraceae bacterium]MDD3615564.1 amino acid ABC transporter permease [Lachnospiraceae bacterium]